MKFGLDCRVACAPRNDKIVNVWGWGAFLPMRLVNCLPIGDGVQLPSLLFFMDFMVKVLPWIGFCLRGPKNGKH